ncbi:cyclase family protein, partial [Enterococcus faecium]|uniref:cyclase family protein n=1 Tax=Enterococcus faecium TaxID=1352 RepID=UPI003AAC1488
MDAPLHVDSTSVVGIDRVSLEQAMGSAVLLHVPTARDQGGIRDRDLDDALAVSGEELVPGDILLVRTGCSDTARSDPRGYATTAAGLDKSAAEWVRGRGVKAFGIDCVTIEAARSRVTADAHTNFLRP